MGSIFTKIIDGELPCYKVAETDKFLAFLDINPIKKGHTLVIPKQEVDYFFDLPEDLLQELMLFAKDVAESIQKAIPCDRIGISVIGLDVPHAHMHLIPIWKIADMDFSAPKLKLSEEELSEVAASIISA